MKSKVLIVDDDKEMLLSLKEGLERYSDVFSVIKAEDGVIATEKLNQDLVSIVVTDLKMPRMDGFELLSYIMENFPEIPVIIITAYSTPEMEKLAKKGGAIGYIEKPFLIDELAKKIIEILRREADGGSLHDISSGMFIQLIEMEQKTCTIRIKDKRSGKQGIMFFNEGVLMDAKVNGIKGEEALYEIFSWDQVDLSIQNSCPIKECHVEADLRAILLDAIRRRDEEKAEQIEEIDEAELIHDEELLSKIKAVFQKEIRERTSSIKPEFNDKYDKMILMMEELGLELNAGEFKLCYIEKGKGPDLLLVPAGGTIVVEVGIRIPKEKIINKISDLV